MSANYKLREFQEGDRNFILNSWLLSNRSCQKDMENCDYFPSVQRYITILLERANTLMFVSPEDENHIYGFVCFETFTAGHIIHYVYLKHPYRGFGLFREFCTQFVPKVQSDRRPIYITHRPKNLANLKAVHNISYDPFLIWS